MKQLLWHRLDHYARSVSPFLVTMLLTIFSAVPLRLPDLSLIMPSLTLIAVYYWVVHKPGLLPIVAVGSIGLLQDLLSGGPPGVSIIVLLLLQFAVERQRKLLASASFGLIWIIFMVLAAGATALTWGLTSLSLMVFFDPKPVFFQYLMTVAIYPCFAWVMFQGQRFFET